MGIINWLKNNKNNQNNENIDEYEKIIEKDAQNKRCCHGCRA